MTRYDFISKHYDTFLGSLERNTLDMFRQKFVPMIKGYTLDLAVGTGNNIKYYPENSKVVLIDKSVKMLEIAKQKSLDRKDLDLKFISTSVENMPFKDETFDTILSIDVFCSVKNPFNSMLEVKRVLKNGGTGIFVEHGLTGNILKDFMLYLTTLITYPLAGSSMVRKPLDYIKHAEFQIKEYGYLKGSFYYFIVRKEF